MADQFIGEIRIFAGNYAPSGWLICNGAILPISQYTDLFSVLSTNYGGNGVTNFGLPDFTERVPIDQGQGPGLTNRHLGDRGGLEGVILKTQNMPKHRHNLMGTNTIATEKQPFTNSFANTSGSYLFYNKAISEDMVSLATETIGVEGENRPHYNMMPYTVMNFIIATQGIYPEKK